MPKSKILLIDDTAEFSEELQRRLREVGYDVQWLDSAEDGLRQLSENAVDLVLLDNKMPRMSGIEFLTVVKERKIASPNVILMTAAHDADTAIQATKLGAFGYVIKPLDYDAILAEMRPEIERALKISRPAPPVSLPTADAPQANEDGPLLIGQCKAMLEVYRHIAEAAGDDEPVLILGETGTGKDPVAQAIHTNSYRHHKPFVVVNCPALTETLLESELFGHEKGAFTGADKMRKGHFEHAHGGTIFLDEVGDMPPLVQAKLLRVLQNGEITRVGSSEPIKVDVRVLAATNRDMKTLVFEGTFRMDLFFRLEGMTIHLPPLRDRQEDLERLANHFLRQLCQGQHCPPTLHPDALQEIRDHPLPGNVRQLINVMHRARRAVMARRGSQILPEDLDFGALDSVPLPYAPPAAGPSPSPTHSVPFSASPFEEATNEDMALACLGQAIAWYWKNDQRGLWPLVEQRLESAVLRHALAAGMSQVKIAERLGISRNKLRDRLEQHGLKKPAEGG